MKKRPRTVPKEATYFPDWDEWGVGQMVDGKMEGDWKLWRGDGQYVEESPWRNGKTHGDKRRFHDDGSLASIATYVDGVMTRILMYRTKKKTREPNFDLPKNIHEIDFLYTDDGWQNCQRFRTKKGEEVELHGKPVPPKPAGLPERAYFNAEDDHWLAGEWRIHEGTNERRGIYRYWTPGGELIRIEYYGAGQNAEDEEAETAIFDRRPGEPRQSNPLFAATVAKDEAAVAICWEAGLQFSTGAVLHAAHDGLFDLALRIQNAPRTEPLLPESITATRRGNIPEDAVWIAGLERWVIGAIDDAGRPKGTWKLWNAPEGYTFVKAEEIDFTDGKKRAFREYDSDGEIEEEKVWDENGKLIRERKTDYGVTEETEYRADGTIALQRFHKDSTKLQAARVVKDGTLVVEAWFDENGTKRAEVIPAPPEWLKKLRRAKHHGGDEDEGEGDSPPELFTSGDVQGLVGAGLDGHALGTWKVGTGKADFSVVHMHKNEELADDARSLAVWQKKKPKPSKIPWKKLETFFDSGEHFPFYLQGLETDDPRAVRIAVDHMSNPVLHQSTISDIAGPTFRAMAEAVGAMKNAESIAYVLWFMVGIATRDGDIDSANQNKQLYLAKPKNGGKYFGNQGVEPAYFDVCDAVTQTTDTWIRLATHPENEIRDRAIILLALSIDPRAEAALLDRVTSESDADLRAEAVLALGLHRPKREFLERLLSAEPMLRVAAALTWIRTHIEPYDPAAKVLLECLTDPPTEWDLYLGTRDVQSEAAATLTLLPPKQSAAYVEQMCASLETADGKNAVALSKALLDLAFGDYEEGQKLTAGQRTILAAIASSDAAWTFNVNLAEVLRDRDLPDDRASLRAALEGTPAPEKPSTRILSAFGGPAGGVASFVKKTRKKK